MPAAIVDELRQSIVRMLALGIDRSLIEAISGVSERTIRDIKQRWEETGSARAPEHAVGGRPRLLEIGDLWVSAFV